MSWPLHNYRAITPEARGRLDDVAWLRARYLDDQMSLTAIGRKLNCAASTVALALARHGIPTRAPGAPLRPARLDDGPWLRERYVDNGLSCNSIAALLGCHRETVGRALHRHGIPIRRPRPARLDDGPWLRERYVDNGLSCNSIAALLGCDAQAVRRALRHHGIQARRGSRYPQLRDADWLRKSYVDDRKSLNTIAAELGCSDMTVISAMKRHGIARRRKQQGARIAYAERRRLVELGRTAEGKRQLNRLAKDTGAVGKAYTTVIRLLQALDQVPYTGREHNQLENEAIAALHGAEDALGLWLRLSHEVTS